VVPVHELGTFPDLRPYFTMKLVRGETLNDMLRARTSPADDLPRFLSIFESICQTMAYAHARGVIHRDLKPSNVMVGKFGEVQVMDSGLAKVMAQAGPDDVWTGPCDDPIRHSAGRLDGTCDLTAIKPRTGQTTRTGLVESLFAYSRHESRFVLCFSPRNFAYLWGGRLRQASAIHSERSPSIMDAPAVLASMVWRTAGSSATGGIPGRRHVHLKGERSCTRDENSGR
jgi:serine/threonine protein kinase